MRVAVLTSSESWYLKDLRRAAGDRFTITSCAFGQLAARVGQGLGASVSHGEHDLGHQDAMLIRSMPPGSLEQVVFRMDALARLQQQGCLVINPPRALEISIDKYLTLARVADAHLPVPPTVTCQTWQHAMTAFDDLGRDIVLKPLFGGEGRGVTRLNDEALALRAFKMLEQLGAVLYLQQYIPHHGYDLRLLVLGEQVLAMRRSNPNDWRTNVSLGATCAAEVVDDRLRDIARRAAEAVGAPLAGVDLLPARDGRVFVLEVNAVPGWKALGRTLHVDVASRVLDYLALQVRGLNA